jgi:outer membrane protein assembly factor BamB
VPIIVTCQKCQKKYQLNPELLGKRIRCPNPACREIIEVKETEESKDPADSEVLPGDSIDLVPIPEEQKYSSPGKPGYVGPVAEMVPILPTEKESVSSKPAPRRPQTPERVERINLEDLVKLEVPDYSPPSSEPKPPPVRPRKEKKKRREYPVAQPAVPPSPPPRTEHTLSAPPRPAPVASSPPAAKSEVPSWQNAPPPVRESKAERDTLILNREQFFAGADQVAVPDLFAHAQPVAESPPSEELPSYELSATEESYSYPEPSGRRRARWIILAMFAMVVGLTGAGGWIVYRTVAATEDKRAKQANQEYEDGNYVSAADHFKTLWKDFPKSNNAALYEFLFELSDARSQVYQTGSDPKNALDQLNAFVKSRQGDPVLQEHAKDVWQTYRKSIEDLTALSQQSLSLPPHVEDSRSYLSAAQRAFNEAKSFAAREGGHEETQQKLLAHIQQLGQEITKLENQARAVATIRDLKSSPDDIWQADRLIRKFNLQREKEVTDLVEQLKAKLITQVTYEQAPAVPPAPPNTAPPGTGLESLPSGLLVALQVGSSEAPPTGGGVIFALVRGVLYAMSETDGKVLWATRVGTDTYNLPVRTGEMVLVPSPDSNILIAREVGTGKPLWRYDLKASSKGRPMIVGGRAYVATLDGKIHEIDLADGHPLGWYQLGTRLSMGGAWQEGSDLLYVPADSLCVYVLDLSQHRCEGILFSGHPSGSLRSEPILIGTADSPEPRYLLLSQADGISAMKLRIFPLPIAGTATVPALQPEPRLRGWSWFPPYSDSEKIVFSTDAGVIGWFGINQPGNEDKPIFQQLQKEGSVGENSSLPVRSQVISVAENDFWVVANGNLQLMHFDVFGQRIVPLWERSLAIGIPLHAAQVDEKTRTIFTVTQSQSGQSSLVTAVSAEDGKVRWQRQLGMDCKGDPVVLGSEILALGQGGELFQFDSGSLSPGGRGQGEGGWDWQTGGRLAGGPVEGIEGNPYLLRDPDRQSAFEVACVPKKISDKERRFDLVVRRYEPGKNLAEKKFPLNARLMGTPGLAGGNLLLLLDDGTLLRQPWDDKRGDYGPGWRGRTTDPAARGHVVVISPEEFLTSDGHRSLSRWRWPAGKIYQEDSKAELPNPIATLPVIWRGETGKDAPLVCLADSRGFIRLLGGSDLKEIRRWNLKGQITAGPFARGKHIGCVVDQRRLVWIDPTKDKIASEYQGAGEGIVGQPRIIGETVVVADLTGRFVGLDPTTGEKRWQADSGLGMNVAPTATPVEFGPDRAFVPLTDGTVLLLSLKNEPNK